MIKERKVIKFKDLSFVLKTIIVYGFISLTLEILFLLSLLIVYIGG